MGFDEEVWAIIGRIPNGRVTTYKMIAEKLGTKAYRAVGNACRRNPRAPEIPCHRVINSDGRVGGYMGKTSGPQVKKKIQMLREEGIKIKGDRVLDLDRVLFVF